MTTRKSNIEMQHDAEQAQAKAANLKAQIKAQASVPDAPVSRADGKLFNDVEIKLISEKLSQSFIWYIGGNLLTYVGQENARRNLMAAMENLGGSADWRDADEISEDDLDFGPMVSDEDLTRGSTYDTVQAIERTEPMLKARQFLGFCDAHNIPLDLGRFMDGKEKQFRVRADRCFGDDDVTELRLDIRVYKRDMPEAKKLFLEMEPCYKYNPDVLATIYDRMSVFIDKVKADIKAKDRATPEARANIALLDRLATEI